MRSLPACFARTPRSRRSLTAKRLEILVSTEADREAEGNGTHLLDRTSRTLRRSSARTPGTITIPNASASIQPLLRQKVASRCRALTICQTSLLTPFAPLFSRNSNHHCVYSSFQPSSGAPLLAITSSPSVSCVAVCTCATNAARAGARTRTCSCIRAGSTPCPSPSGSGASPASSSSPGSCPPCAPRARVNTHHTQPTVCREWMREDAPERLPALRPALARPLAHRGRLELVRDREEHDVLRVHPEVLAQPDRAVHGDIVPIGVYPIYRQLCSAVGLEGKGGRSGRTLVLVEERVELARGRRGACACVRVVVVRVEGEVEPLELREVASRVFRPISRVLACTHASERVG
ncbi:hypothetical protein C8Q77DRAFT_863609 [Trametes polyzona]|nr:hypothetical protein C8Q77DRAFT_863609 [Trametes polyzona]